MSNTDRNKPEYRAILRSMIMLAIPTMTEHIMSTLMQYVDTAMVGRLGEKATASVSTTTTISWLVSSIPWAVSTATLALVSKANGEKNVPKMKRLTGQSMTLTLILGMILTGICVILSPYIPVWMGAEEAVQGPASEYFFIQSLSMIPRTAMYTCGAAIRATKDTRVPMRINLTANLLNVVLNYVFIYALHMGVRGAAIATAISYTIGGIVMYAVMMRRDELKYSLTDIRPDTKLLKEFGGIAVPAMGTSVTSCLGYVFFAGMVSGMGTVTFAAHSIAVTAEELFYIPGYGLRTATSTLIGNALGERDERKLHITEYLSIQMTVLMMFLSGVVLFFVAYPLMRVFTISADVASLGAQMLKLVAFTEPFFGLMIVIEGIFYGKGKAKGIFVVETASMWGIRILSTFLCVKVWGLGLREVWYCMIADNICKALCLTLLYVRDRKNDAFLSRM